MKRKKRELPKYQAGTANSGFVGSKMYDPNVLKQYMDNNPAFQPFNTWNDLGGYSTTNPVSVYDPTTGQLISGTNSATTPTQTVQPNTVPVSPASFQKPTEAFTPLSDVTLPPSGRTQQEIQQAQITADSQIVGATPEFQSPDNQQNYYQQPQSMQYYNPYGGFSIPNAAFTLGQGIENGDALSIAASGLKLATGLGRNFMAGYAGENRRNYVMQDYANKAREKSMGNWQYQDGGETAQDQNQSDQMSPEQIITLYAQSTGQDPQAIIQQISQLPQDQQQQAIQQMSAALQDQGGQNNIQTMQSGGTSKQREGLYKSLTGEYVQEIPGGEKVGEIEEGEYLQKPNTEIQKAIGDKHADGGVELTEEQLPGGSKIISDFDKVGADVAKDIKDKFEIDAKAKDTYARILDKYDAKSGLKGIVDEQEALVKQLDKQSQKLKEDPERETAISLNIDFLKKELSELDDQKKPLEEARKILFDEVFQHQEAAKPKEEQATSTFQGGGQQPYVQDQRFQDFYKNAMGLGYNGAQDIGSIQAFMAQNYPQQVTDYFNVSGQPLTAKHVDIIKDKYNTVFQQTGISPDKPSASYTVEEKAKLKSALGGQANQEFLLAGFQDGLWDWRAPATTIGNSAYQPGTVSFNPSAPTNPMNMNPDSPSSASTNPETPLDPTQIVDNSNVQSNRNGFSSLLLPDQSPLLPESLQPALKIDRRYDRVEAPFASGDAAIQEIRRQEQTAIKQTESLPDAQRAAAIAQIQASTQEQLNKVTSTVEGQNLGSRFQANTQNAQIQMAEENARADDLKSYEFNILTADAKTQANVRNFYNQNQKVNLNNYNAIQNQNLLNNFAEHSYMSPNGLVVEQNYVPDYNSVSASDTYAAKLAEFEAMKKLTTKEKRTRKR